MNASELRIGNWYMGASRSDYKQATGAFIKDFDEGLLSASPIPLTAEILEKSGFKDSDEWELGSFWLRFLTDGSCQVFIEGHVIPKTTIQYVHQLQNLYYALTQKELTINL